MVSLGNIGSYAVKGVSAINSGVNEIGRIKARASEYVSIAAAVFMTFAGIAWFISYLRSSKEDKEKKPFGKIGPILLVIVAIVCGLCAWYQSYVASSTSAYAKVMRRSGGASTAVDATGMVFRSLF